MVLLYLYKLWLSIVILKLKIALLVFVNGLRCLWYATTKTYKRVRNSKDAYQVNISLLVARKNEKYEAANPCTKVTTIKDHKDITYK